jgi:excisionase family DNA binding protein
MASEKSVPLVVITNSRILLRVGEAARSLSISIWKMRQLAYEKEVVSVKVGSLLMFRPEDLEHFAERNRVL